MSETLPLVLCLSVAGLVSGLTGFAFALVAAGTVMSLRPPIEAAVLVLVCSVLAQSVSVLRLKTMPPRVTALAMIVPGLIGAPGGVALLRHLDPYWIKIAVGSFLVGYSAFVAALRPGFRVGFGSLWSDAAVGFLGGVLGGIAGLSGALPAAWSLVRGWDARTARAIYQSYALVLQVWALAILILSDPIPAGLSRDLVLAVPVVLVSTLLGFALFARIDQGRFRTIVLALLFVIGSTTTILTLLGH